MECCHQKSSKIRKHRTFRRRSDVILVGRPINFFRIAPRSNETDWFVFEVKKILEKKSEVFVGKNVTVAISENWPWKKIDLTSSYVMLLKKYQLNNSMMTYQILIFFKMTDIADKNLKGIKQLNETNPLTTFYKNQIFRKKRSIRSKKLSSKKSEKPKVFTEKKTFEIAAQPRTSKKQGSSNSDTKNNNARITLSGKKINKIKSNKEASRYLRGRFYTLKAVSKTFPINKAFSSRSFPQIRRFRYIFPTKRVSLKTLQRSSSNVRYSSGKKIPKFTRPSGKILKFLRDKKIAMMNLLSSRRSLMNGDEFVHVSQTKANTGNKGRVVGCPTLNGVFRLTRLLRNGFQGLVYIPPLQMSLTNGWILQLKFNIPVKNISSSLMKRVKCGMGPKQQCLAPINLNSKIAKYQDLKLNIKGSFSSLRGYVQSRVSLMGICKGSRDFSERRTPIVEESSSSGASLSSPSDLTEATISSTAPSQRCRTSSPNGIPSSGGHLTHSWKLTGSEKSKVDYNELLHKSILFYEAQRSGRLPITNRIPWRGDADLKDGCPMHIDLTGGWYNSGGNVKTTPLIAFTTTLLAWGAIDYQGSYQASGEFDRMMTQIQWATDYLLKCQISPSTLIVQIGDYVTPSKTWTRPSSSKARSRVIHRAHVTMPASDVAGEMAAALAAASILFNHTDSDYAQKCLSAARKSYEFGIEYPGRYRFMPQNSAFWYNYNHDPQDEMAWGALWLYRASGEEKYLDLSEEGFRNMRHKSRQFSMRQKFQATAILLAKLTNANYYTELANDYAAWFIRQASRNSGRSLIRPVNTNMYIANAAFLALQAAEVNGTSGIIDRIKAIVERQMERLVGVSGQGYVVGVGKNPPKRPYHRGSSCPKFPFYCTKLLFRRNRPNPHILYGALVSGTNKYRKYLDISGNYFQNNVRIDYNAGFQGVAAGMLSLNTTT